MSAIKFLFRILFNKQSRTDSKISSNFGQEQFKIKKTAKIKHNNFIDTVDEVLSGAKKEGVLHLYAEHKILTGRTIKIKGKEVFHFGTTGYLGLEQDIRLKEAAIAAINNYGAQFPLSKSYISDPLYSELEQKMK